MTISYLWLLASAAVCPFTSGSQGILTIEALGNSWETDRRVRVSRAHGPQQEEDDSMSWEGPGAEWCDAVVEAAARPAFPGTVPGWEPGPYEAAFRAAQESLHAHHERLSREARDATMARVCEAAAAADRLAPQGFFPRGES